MTPHSPGPLPPRGAERRLVPSPARCPGPSRQPLLSSETRGAAAARRLGSGFRKGPESGDWAGSHPLHGSDLGHMRLSLEDGGPGPSLSPGNHLQLPSCPAHAQRRAPLLAPLAGWVPHLDGPLRGATPRTGWASWALCLLLHCMGRAARLTEGQGGAEPGMAGEGETDPSGLLMGSGLGPPSPARGAKSPEPRWAVCLGGGAGLCPAASALACPGGCP